MDASPRGCCANGAGSRGAVKGENGMRRLEGVNILTVYATVAACTGGVAAQHPAPVYPWPTESKSSAATRDPSIRKASLVESLDHKKKTVKTQGVVADGAREVVLIDEPFPVVDVPQAAPVPGVPMIDPTLAPLPPPMASHPIMPIPTSKVHKAQPGLFPSRSIPIVIDGPSTPQVPIGPPANVPLGDPALVEGGPPPDLMGSGIVPVGAVEEQVRTVPSIDSMLPGPYVEVGVLYLQRVSGRDEFITRTQFDGESFFERSSADFTSDFEPGVRVVVGAPFACGWYGESSFMGLNLMEANQSVNAGRIVDSFTTFPLLGTFTEQQSSLRTRFTSGEANTKWAVSVFPTSFVMFGLRNFYIEERFLVRETGRVAIAGGTAPAVGTMDVLAKNSIFGPQIGFETRWNTLGWRFSFDSHVKAGFGWDAQRVRVTRTLSDSVVGPTAVSHRDRQNDVTGWVEVMTAATFRLTPTISLRGGWQFISVLGYASGPLQRPWAFFQADQRFELDSTERGYFQGPFASLEFTWGGFAY
jgi:hypothetical protein